MRFDHQFEDLKQRLEWQGNAPSGVQRFFTRLLAVATAGALLVVTLMFSALLFAAALTLGLAIWGRVWWKTRALRKQMREHAQAFAARQHTTDSASGGRVIEGEVIR
jgi:hypothetical protein